MADELVAGALSSEAQLRELYGEPMQRALDKDIGRLDAMCRRLIAVAPIVFVASHDADGNCDVTPRGGQPGFVAVLDDDHLAIPDATGNRRLDTLANIIATGHAGLLFLVPGRDQTLRVNGRARVTAAPHVLERVTAVGKPPRSAIVVAADEVYAHCPKAFVRSRFWRPETWSLDGVPTAAEVMAAHHPDPARSVAAEQDYLDVSLRTRLA
jgi:uncharacterized protein